MNDLETHVLHIIGEDVDSPDAFSDITPVRDSINDAIQEICMVTGTYTRMYHLNTYSGRTFYRIPFTEDYYGYVLNGWNRSKQWRLQKTDIQALNKKDPRWLQMTGDIIEYVQVGMDIIGLYMKPSSEVVLELQCVVIPKAYDTDNAPIKLRDMFRDGAVYYAVSEFYASRARVDEAKDYYNRYLGAVGLAETHPEYAERDYAIGGRPWDRTMTR